MKKFFFIVFFVMTHLPASKPPLCSPFFTKKEIKPKTPFHQKLRPEGKRTRNSFFKASTVGGASLYTLQFKGEKRLFDKEGNELFE